MTNPPPGKKKKTLPVAAIILIFALVALLIAYWFRPRPKPVPCIQLPELTQESLQRPAMEMAAELEAIPLDAHLSANFEEVSSTTFQTVSEKQVAFLLLLRAIDCYLKTADTPEQLALVEKVVPELIATARSMWAASHSLKGDADRLSIKERAILDDSPYGPAIVDRLKTHGTE